MVVFIFTPALRWHRQADLCKFEARLVYRLSFRTVRTVLQKSLVLEKKRSCVCMCVHVVCVCVSMEFSTFQDLICLSGYHLWYFEVFASYTLIGKAFADVD